MKTEALPPITAADQDDLFTLLNQTCADCGTVFATSRRSTYCALCASLRAGQVGPATVQCPACGIEHQVPVLAPSKLCTPCRVDLVLTLANVRARLDAARAAADDAWARLDADLAHADPQDRARYDAACEKRSEWSETRWQTAYDAAVARADGLTPLLVARAAWDTASAALEAAQRAVGAVEEEVGG